MPIHWSASARGFFDDKLGKMPADAKEITPELHAQVGSGQNSATEIVTDAATGLPILAPRVIPPHTTETAQAALMAAYRVHSASGISFTPKDAAAPILFPTDDAALGRYHAASFLLRDGIIMLAKDGTPHALSIFDAQALIARAMAFVDACASTYAVLFAKIAADPNADLTGWPANT